MAPDPLDDNKVAGFPATKLAPLLRAIADPEGNGKLSVDQSKAIDRIEANLSRRRGDADEGGDAPAKG